MVARSDAIGGTSVHIRDLAATLIERGHKVTVVIGGEGPVTEALAERDVPYVSLKHLGRSVSVYRDARAFAEIRQTLKRLEPDLLSTHNAKAGILGRMAARTLGVPVLFTAHGWIFTDGVPALEASLYRTAERLAAPLADRIITVSEFDRRLAMEQRVAPADKLICVHNGMPDVPEAAHAQPEQDPPRLVMVARFEPQKDHDTLLRALAPLTNLPWQLDLIGDGQLRGKTEAQVKQLGLTERVHFLGVRTDVTEQLTTAQIFLLISNWEGFPRSILEAMRAGLPVIASDVGGSNESVSEGTSGFLIPRGDVETLRTRLEQLLRSAELRQRLGCAGRRRYEAEFTFEAMLAKTVQVYADVLGEAPEPGLA